MSSSISDDRTRLERLFRSQGAIPGLGDCSGISLSAPLHVSAQSRLYCGTFPGRTEKLLIKVAIDSETGGPEPAFAREQFEVLHRLSAKGADVPKPVHLFEEQGISVQSWVEGQSLDRVLARRDVSSARIAQYCREAGGLLARFHLASGVEMRPLSVAHLAAELKEAGGAALQAAIQAMELARPRVEARRHLFVRLHCDFKPSNLIASPKGLVTIDFHESELAPACFDAAHFLNSVMLDALKAGRISWLLHAQAAEADFLQEYGKTAPALDDLALRLFLVYDLARYLSCNAAAGALKSFVARWLLARRVAALKAA